MEIIEKEGLVVIQGVGKFGKKSWKRIWMQLYQPSASGVGRIELYEMKDGPLGFSGGTSKPPGLKRMEKRVIRLTDCLSISPAPEESCPNEFSAFDVNTTQRTYTFAAPCNEDWMQTLCELAFLKSYGPSDARKILRGEDTSMSENELYSTWKAGHYQVKVQQTEAAMRCQLAGSYGLSLSSEALSLQDRDTSEVIYCWPYRLLRRFGTVKDGGVTIEAGRRCESGEGHFVFLSKQGQEIYWAMEEAIAKQTGRHHHQQEPRPGPPAPPEQQPATLSLIPRPPSLDKPRSSTPPQPALPQRRNISLPDIPQTKPQQQPNAQRDIYAVIEMPRPQPRPPRMRPPLPQVLPSLGSSRDRDDDDDDDEERCDSLGSDSCDANEDSVVYAKLSGAHHNAYEEAPNCPESESAYSTVSRLSPAPRRAQLETQRERVTVQEEEEEKEEVVVEEYREGERERAMRREREREWLRERHRDWSKERERMKEEEEKKEEKEVMVKEYREGESERALRREREREWLRERHRDWSKERERMKEAQGGEESSQIVTTSSAISVNFKQTLASMLFKDLAKVQLQAAKPTDSHSADSDGTIYQNRLDM